jgi:hypothetical protein
MTDNLGLLTRIKKSLPYPEPFPNLTLLSDWDVTNEIVQTLHSTKMIPTLEHVQGHQDDHTPYEELTLDAQLNVVTLMKPLVSISIHTPTTGPLLHACLIIEHSFTYQAKSYHPSSNNPFATLLHYHPTCRIYSLETSGHGTF